MADSPNPADAYAPITLEPAVQEMVNTIQGQLHSWIDRRIDELGKHFEQRAEGVTAGITAQFQSKFESVSEEMAASLQATRKALGDLKPKLSQAGLTKEVAGLEAAIKAHQEALEKRRQEFRQYGQVVGQTAKALLLTAVKV